MTYIEIKVDDYDAKVLVFVGTQVEMVEEMEIQLKAGRIKQPAINTLKEKKPKGFFLGCNDCEIAAVVTDNLKDSSIESILSFVLFRAGERLLKKKGVDFKKNDGAHLMEYLMDKAIKGIRD